MASGFSYDKKKFHRYMLNGVPKSLWKRITKICEDNGTSIRVFILSALKDKVDQIEGK